MICVTKNNGEKPNLIREEQKEHPMKEMKKYWITTVAAMPLALGIAGAGSMLALSALSAGPAQAAEKKMNPCNPCAANKKMMNPCNPCAAKKKMMNPCNPCAANKKMMNPCNPCAAQKKK